MPRQIDHVVIISGELDSAVDNARAAGFTVIPGGTHGDGRTHNALVAFADGAYIELIAPTGSMDGDHRWFPRLRGGGGLVDYCLLADSLDDEIRAIRERGVEYPASYAMARNRPDGERLEWKLSTPPGAVGAHGWPFLIEDTTPRDRRVPGTPDEVLHQNGALGVAGISVLVEEMDTAQADFAAILGTTGRPITAPFSDEVTGIVFPVSLRTPQWIMLVEPRSREAIDHIDRYGQGPWRVTLRTHDGGIAPGEGDFLDPALFSGARIVLA